MSRVAARPTAPSPARLRRGPSLSPLKGGEGLFPVNFRLRDKSRVQLVSVPRKALRNYGNKPDARMAIRSVSRGSEGDDMDSCASGDPYRVAVDALGLLIGWRPEPVG